MKTKFTEALAEGGFTLTKFDSSHPEVLNDDPENPLPIINQEVEESFEPTMAETTDRAEPTRKKIADLMSKMGQEDYSDATKSFLRTDEKVTKVLGLGWELSQDELYVRVPEKLDKPVTTKRGMLKLIASVYDPIGLVSPFVLRERILMQRANELELGWDDHLPPEIAEPFEEWKSSMPGLKRISPKVDIEKGFRGRQDRPSVVQRCVAGRLRRSRVREKVAQRE